MERSATLALLGCDVFTPDKPLDECGLIQPTEVYLVGASVASSPAQGEPLEVDVSREMRGAAEPFFFGKEGPLSLSRRDFCIFGGR